MNFKRIQHNYEKEYHDFIRLLNSISLLPESTSGYPNLKFKQYILKKFITRGIDNEKNFISFYDVFERNYCGMWK
jgi:hypothetical protein